MKLRTCLLCGLTGEDVTVSLVAWRALTDRRQFVAFRAASMCLRVACEWPRTARNGRC